MNTFILQKDTVKAKCRWVEYCWLSSQFSNELVHDSCILIASFMFSSILHTEKEKPPPSI